MKTEQRSSDREHQNKACSSPHDTIHLTRRFFKEFVTMVKEDNTIEYCPNKMFILFLLTLLEH